MNTSAQTFIPAALNPIVACFTSLMLIEQLIDEWIEALRVGTRRSARIGRTLTHIQHMIFHVH
jgi:hypothetical protein